VAVLSTGDEVQDASTGAPRPGCIYDSNRPMLIALFKQYGFSVVDMGIIRDE
jgi:molybdopterin molybdotransferase